MADRGVIFSAPMVRALLDGRKTQTRRLLKPQLKAHRPPYAPGDRLWVREAWGHDAPSLDDCRRGVESLGALSYGPYYMADGRWLDSYTIKRRSPIHMPRWASRLTLVVTEVRVQRLHEISEADAEAEGCEATQECCGHGRAGWGGEMECCGNPRVDYAWEAYARLWNSIHGPGAWALNPWVAAVSFTVHRCNIDSMGAM